MTEQTLKQYLAMLEKGGLVSREQLQAAVAALSPVAGGEVTVDALTAYLIEQKQITPWHAEKLLAGRYRGFFLGKYKLLTLLGSGGMCSVYLAEHQILRQLRAIKVLPRNRVADRSYLDRFYREGRAAAALNHPNIVRVYDIDHEGETHYLVMEYVEGWNLYDYVKQQGPLDFGVTLDYILQAAIGLQHAHALGLVHRDIKPANLLVTDANILKISDLGLALFREEDYSLTMAHNERVLGTADYLAPEQAVNSHNVDHRADIYGLGCSLYYLLSGSPPFPTGSLAQRIAMHQSVEPTPLQTLRPDCPPEIAQLCERMMKKSPADRFQDCRELQQELQRIQQRLKQPAGSGKAKSSSSASSATAAHPGTAAPAKSNVKKAGPPPGSPARPAATGPAAAQTVLADSGNATRRTPPTPAAPQPTTAKAAPPAPPTSAPSLPPSGSGSAKTATSPTSTALVKSASAAKAGPAPAAASAVPAKAAVPGAAAKPPGPAGSSSAATPPAGLKIAPPSNPSPASAEQLPPVPRVRAAPRRRNAQRQQLILIGVIAGLAILLVLVLVLAFRLTVRSSSSSWLPARHNGMVVKIEWIGETGPARPGVLAGFARSTGFGQVQPPSPTI